MNNESTQKPSALPRRVLWLAVLLPLLLGALLLERSRQPPTRPSAAPQGATLPDLPAKAGSDESAVAATGATATEPPRQQSQAIAAVEQALASGSLRGTTADGAIELGPDGRLKPNQALKQWFDYYLSLVGEVLPPAIRSWIADHLARTQPPAVREQVLRALDAYLAYLADVDRVARLQTAADPAQRLQLLKDLRRQHLGTEMADGFFADEERAGDYLLARRALARDPTLTDQQRRERLAAMEAELPDGVRQPLEEFRRSEADLARNAEIAAASSDPLQRFAEREQQFGAEAAARLEQLDQEQARWQARLQAYARERQRLAADAALSVDQRAAALARFRQQQFDASEQQRVEALEQAGALPPP